MINEQVYQTIDIDRRGYGRRYTCLPVDQLDRAGFSIDFTGAYMRPEMIDIRPGDIARWRDGERRLEGRIVEVRREKLALHVSVEDTHLLSPEDFHP